MQTAIVFIIVIIAAISIARHIVRLWSGAKNGETGCSCGCGGCNVASENCGGCELSKVPNPPGESRVGPEDSRSP